MYQEALLLGRGKEVQLAPLAAPGKLHLARVVVVIQSEPGAQLQFERPCPHGLAGGLTTLRNDDDVRCIDACDHFDAVLVQVQIAHTVFGQKIFQARQVARDLGQLVCRNGFGARHECIGKNVADAFDLLVLRCRVHAQHGHAFAQPRQQVGQLRNDLRTLGPRGFGTGRPQQV